MSKYTDFTTNFKLIQAADSHNFTKRNLSIWSMILNRLGLPDSLHEPVMAIYVSGNWQESKWDEITVMRMARNLTSNIKDQERIYNRLKKSLPRFFDWQQEQPFIIIDREILTERASRYKTKARYSFLLYDLVFDLFNLPSNIPRNELRRTVDEALKDYPKVEKPPRKPRKKRAKAIISAISRNISDLIELEGSVESAAYEASQDETVREFCRSIVDMKNSMGE